MEKYEIQDEMETEDIVFGKNELYLIKMFNIVQVTALPCFCSFALCCFVANW